MIPLLPIHLHSLFSDEVNILRFTLLVGENITGTVTTYANQTTPLKVIKLEDTEVRSYLRLEDLLDVWYEAQTDPEFVLHLELRPMPVVLLRGAEALDGLQIELSGPDLTANTLVNAFADNSTLIDLFEYIKKSAVRVTQLNVIVTRIAPSKYNRDELPRHIAKTAADTNPMAKMVAKMQAAGIDADAHGDGKIVPDVEDTDETKPAFTTTEEDKQRIVDRVNSILNDNTVTEIDSTQAPKPKAEHAPPVPGLFEVPSSSMGFKPTNLAKDDNTTFIRTAAAARK